MIKCPLCGYRFDENRTGDTCEGCPIHSKCNLMKCPNCGYKMPRKSRLLKVLGVLKGKVK